MIPILSEVEMLSPEKLQAEIKTLLTDDRRSGRSPIFTQERILKIIDLACKHPSDFGYGNQPMEFKSACFWIKNKGIAEQISAKSVSRFLKMR